MNHDRYSRQILFSGIGESGQRKLFESNVLIVGAGALGTSIAEMLTRAGVGRLTIVDRDYVEWSNLQRQQLYTEEDASSGVPKALAACQKLAEINQDVQLEPITADFFDYIKSHTLENFQLIMDATDNFETRLLINDLAQTYRLPWIYGGATGSTGITYTVRPGVTPCLQCMLEALPAEGDTCDTVGIIAPTIQWVTAHQVNEAFKLLTGNYEALRNTLLYTNLWTNHTASLKLASLKKDDCPSCGSHPIYPYLNSDKQKQASLAVLCGRDTVQIRLPDHISFNREQVERNLQQLSIRFASNDHIIHAKLSEQKRVVVFQDGRILIHGTKNISEAESLYHQLIKL